MPLLPIHLLQKKAVRIIAGTRFLVSSSNFFHDLKLLTLTDLYSLQLAVFMYCGFSPLLSSPSFFLHPVRTQRLGRPVYPILPPLHSQRLTPVGSPAVQGEAGFVAPVGLQFEGFQSRRTL